MLQTNLRSETRAAAEYNKTWAAKIRRIRRFMSDGASSLDVLNLISTDNGFRYGLLNDPEVGDVMRSGFSDFHLPVDGIETLHRVAATGEVYYPVSRLNVIPAIKRLVESGEVDTVVELGSGSGDNLFRTYHALEWQYRDKASFFGLEFTEQGRQAAALLSDMEPEMDFTGLPFNYYEPDFSALKDRDRRVLFFSNHSIEQITVVPQDLFDALLEFPEMRCLHNEPVGWQKNDMIRRARAADDAEFFSQVRRMMTLTPKWSDHFSFDPVTRAYQSAPVSFNSGWWSYHKNYNTNLIPMLEGLEQAGQIRITEMHLNHSAGNPLNASTFIEWLPA